MDTPQKLHYTESKTGRIRIEDQFGKPYTIIDEVDHRYSRLLVLRFVGMTDGHAAIFRCVCDCGKKVEVTGGALRTGDTKSCGCYSRELVAQRNHERSGVLHDRFRDLTGVKQADGGRLTALNVYDFDENFRHARWLCLCDPTLGGCGKTVVVRRGEFLSGGTKSCGCWKQDVEQARWAGAKNPKFKDGRHMRTAAA